MHFARVYAQRMPHVQIRNLPDDDHRRLKARAALAGQSLSEYLRGIVLRSLEREPIEDLVKRLDDRGPIEPGFDVAAEIRRNRDAR